MGPATFSGSFCADRPDNGKHGVEVLALSAVQGDLDEVLDGLHSLQGIGFFQDFRRHPERLLVYHVFELFQIAAAYRGVQFKQVIHVPAAKRILVKL